MVVGGFGVVGGVPHDCTLQLNDVELPETVLPNIDARD